MNHLRAILGCVSLIALLALAALAQEAPPAEAEKDLAALIEEQNALADQYNAIIRQIKESEEIAKLDETITLAEKSLSDAEAADEAVIAARRQLTAAQADVQAAVEAKLADHAEAGGLQQKIAKAHGEMVEHQWQIALAQFALDHPLSPVGRALASDKELKDAKLLMEKAAAEDKAAAKTALEELRRAKIAALQPGKELLATIDEATAAADRLQQSIVALEERLLPIRREIEAAEKQALADAQAAVETALAAEPLKKLRLARNDAIKAYNAAVNKAIAADPQAGELRKQYEAIAAKVKELRLKN
jgi:hypothetical protein